MPVKIAPVAPKGLMHNQEVPAENLPVVPAERQAAKDPSAEGRSQREDQQRTRVWWGRGWVESRG